MCRSRYTTSPEILIEGNIAEVSIFAAHAKEPSNEAILRFIPYHSFVKDCSRSKILDA